MSSDPNRFGKDVATGVLNESAKRISRAFRLAALHQEGNLTEEEIEGDNLQNYFARFCTFLSERSIPCYADANLEPTHRSKGACLTTDTLLSYIGQHLTDIRAQFPNHLEFQGLRENEFPEWYTRMRRSFQKACDRYQKTAAEGEERFGAVKIRPLYQMNYSSNTAASVDDNDITDFIAVIDVSYILRNLLLVGTRDGRCQSYEKRAWILVNASAAGRSGEVKFQDYSQWTWDPYLNITDISWTELKTIECYSMPMVPDVRYLFDFYHTMGSYWLMENGLYRDEEQIRHGKKNKVFPSLHTVRSDGVGRKLTNVIRETCLLVHQKRSRCSSLASPLVLVQLVQCVDTDPWESYECVPALAAFMAATTDEEMESSAFAIENACWKKRLELIGRDVAAESKKSRNSFKKTYLSIGNMVLEFKRHAKDQVAIYKETKHKDIPLMERNEVQQLTNQRGQGQTPERNSSILGFFSSMIDP